MSTLPYLQGVLRGLLKPRKEVAIVLDTKPHFVPVNISALKVSLHYLEDNQIREVVNKIEKFAANKTVGPIQEPIS